VDLQLAQLQARAGDFAAARLIAGETFEAMSKGSQYCALAWLAHQRNDANAADEFLRMARRCASDQDDATASAILLRVGQVQAARGDYMGARNTADSIPEFAAQGELYRTLALMQKKAGDMAGYLDSVTRARESASRAPGSQQVWLLGLLCHAQAGAHDPFGADQTLHGAIVAAGQMTEATDKVSAWFDVAEAQAGLREVSQCQKSLARAQEALVDLPPRPTGPIEQARRQYVAVVLSLARAGETDLAAELGKQIRAPQDVSAMYWAMADAQSRAGRIKDAQASLAKVQEPMYRAFACRRLAQAYVVRSDAAEMTAWIDGLAVPEERAWAALGAAEGLLGRRVVNPDAGALATLETD